MKTYLLYGFGTAVAVFIWMLIEDAAGLHGAHYNVGAFTHYVTWLILFGGLWLGIKAVRSAAPDQSLAFGRGVGAGTAISAFYALGAGIGAALFFAYINPGFADVLISQITRKLESGGAPQAQIDQAEHMTRLFFHPIPAGIYTFFVSLLLGVVFSLVIAGCLQRRRAEPIPSAQPPAL